MIYTTSLGLSLELLADGLDHLLDLRASRAPAGELRSTADGLDAVAAGGV